jgi:hypothetical protein
MSRVHCRIREASSFGSSWGRTGAAAFARSPCFSAFRLARALPASVFGPVERSAFLRFAAICAAVAMAWAPGEGGDPRYKIPHP